MSSSYEHGSYSERPRDPCYSRSRDQSSRYYSTDSYASSPRSSSYSYCPDRTRDTRYGSPRRRRWPPSPTVEDEADSLAKESGTPPRIDNGRDGVIMPGPVDQYYIMEEVDYPKPPPPKEQSKDTRFIHVSGNSSSTEDRDAGNRRSRPRQAPPLKTDLEDPARIGRRSPSPYAFSTNKPSNNSSKRSSGEYFLSPEAATPSSFHVPRSTPIEKNNLKTPTLNVRRSSDLSAHSNSDSSDSDVDLDPSIYKNDRRRRTYSFNPANVSRENARMALNDPLPGETSTTRPSQTWPKDHTSSSQSSRPPSPPARPRPTDLPDRPRPTDLPERPPRPSFVNSSSSGTTSKTTSTPNPPRPKDSPFSERPAPPAETYKEPLPPRPSYIDSSSSGRTSKTTSIPSPLRPKDSPFPPSPPRSPYEEPKNFTTPLSKPQSRPSSPLFNASSINDLPSPPHSGDGRDPKRYSSAESRSRPEPRVPSSLRHDTLPPPPPRVQVQSPSPARKPTRPYPENDHAGETMPSLDAFAPRAPEINTRVSPTTSRNSSRAASPVFESPKSPRPPLPSRHTGDYSKPSWENSGSDSDSRRRERTQRKPIYVSCPRPEYTTQYNDWYSLEGRKHFAVCPTCFDNIIEPTSFAGYFHQRRPKNATTEVKCDFASPWTRMAWILTLAQPDHSIHILRSLADTAGHEYECPGAEPVQAVWYGLPWDRGFIPNLYICQYDVRQLEALFPSLQGHFTILPQPTTAERPKQICSLRVNGPSFRKRLDTLADIDARAELDRRGYRIPDLTPFADLFPQPCPRDNQLDDHVWHFLPNLPEFTICTPCYNAVIRPGLKAGRGYLAHKVNPLPELVPNDIVKAWGTKASCMLYSPRMRTVWEEADRNNDFGYLMRKATKRKTVEADLQKEMHWLRKKLERLDGRERRVVQDEMARLVEEWNVWE